MLELRSTLHFIKYLSLSFFFGTRNLTKLLIRIHSWIGNPRYMISPVKNCVSDNQEKTFNGD